MLPLYVSESIPSVSFWTLYAVWYLLEMVAIVRLRTAPGASKRDRGSRVVLITGLWTGIFLNFAFAFAVRFATITLQRHALFYFGLALLVVGVVLRHYAMAVLGRFHTMDVTTRAGQPVIESGPYRWVRHPSYAGALLTVAGILLCSTNWLSLACFVIVAAGYAYRIRVEERALAADLGQPYRDYMRRTKRLVPYLL
jgi:protein-S-isoprenylcysteine O-methyltransferase Ste14